MLISYFLKRFYWTFTSIFLILLGILGFSDLLIRLTVLPSLSSVPKILALMLPLIAVLALPLATSLTISIVLGKLYEDSEVIMLYFLSRANRKLIKSIIIFSISIAIPYSYIVFEWAPKSYFRGKQFIVTLAKDRISQLESGVFHNLMSKGSIYFQQRYKDNFKNILLIYRKNNIKYIVSAKNGILTDTTFMLQNGTMTTNTNGKNYIATFATTELNMEKIFQEEVSGVASIDPKFLSTLELFKTFSFRKDVYIELQVRIAQVLWQILLPFLVYFIMLFWCVIGVNNLFVSILIASGNFLLSYMVIGIGKALAKQFVIISFILYFIPIIILFLLILKRKRFV